MAEALGSKRLVSVVFVPKPDGDSPYESAYDQALEGLTAVHPYLGRGEKMEGAEEVKAEKRSADPDAGEEPAKKKKKKEKKE